MTFFDWGIAAFARPGLVRFMGDIAAAYLLSFEATLEVLKDERGLDRKPFEQWLAASGHLDLRCKGLRTLRHLEAHVSVGRIDPRTGVPADSRFGGSRTSWYWLPISHLDYHRLRAPALSTDELDDWNTHCSSTSIRDLMLHGLGKLRDTLALAETYQPT